jgi:hypothetical protein
VTNIGNVLLFITAALCSACALTYGWTTWGGWRDSEVGRHLMSFMISEAAILDLGVVRVAADAAGWPDPSWFRALRVVVFVSLPIVAAWRLSIILRARNGKLTGPDRLHPNGADGAAGDSLTG